MKRARILVVEDEPIAAMELKESLEALGHEVPKVLDSADGVLEATLLHAPDLVIMDIHLKSYSDGIDAATRLSMIRRTPVIFVTAYSNKSVMERAQRAAPAAYLLKPLDDRLLRECVDRALAGPSGPEPAKLAI